MKNRIYLEEIDGVLKFNFLNGTLELDESVYGAYALCPGCGAGKTTIVKQLIELKWNEGILYTAFTKDEVNNMYQFCKTLIGSELINRDGSINTLRNEDIIVLHSDYTSEGTDNNLWRNNPKELMNKKIILCTHAKLLDEPLYLLISTNFNNKMANMFPPTYRSVNNIGNSLPRQWILIDEMTESRMTLANMKKVMFSSLGVLTNKIRAVDEKGRPITKTIDKMILNRSSIYYDDFTNQVKGLGSIVPEFRDLLKDESNELNKIRNERLLENLYLNFQLYANNESNIVKINSSFTDMITGNENTHILLFDGTSDLTLYNSKKFKVQEIETKYNGELRIFKIPFELSRRISSKDSRTQEEIEIELRNKINNTINLLSDLIQKNSKTLIFCWKGFKIDDTEINDNDEFKFSGNIIDRSESGIILNKNFLLPNYIKFKLEELGFNEGKEFSIEYYGSGRDKAINDYRDYDAVILLGKYIVPGSVINDFNIMFNSNITFSDYYSNRVIQAICRTRIRNHNNESLNIYMTDDWSNDVFNKVKSYLGIELSEIELSDDENESIIYMYNKLRGKGITPKKSEQIAKISLLDKNIFNSIIEEYTYRSEIKLDEIFKILPMYEKKVKYYNPIVNYLMKLGIILSIPNEVGRNQYS